MFNIKSIDFDFKFVEHFVPTRENLAHLQNKKKSFFLNNSM